VYRSARRLFIHRPPSSLIIARHASEDPIRGARDRVEERGGMGGIPTKLALVVKGLATEVTMHVHVCAALCADRPSIRYGHLPVARPVRYHCRRYVRVVIEPRRFSVCDTIPSSRYIATTTTTTTTTATTATLTTMTRARRDALRRWRAY